jgi:glycosyltransferase involved in cell wall biosynthesis
MRISAVIIAKNEAAYITQCVASLRGVADEICVFDNGSTDNTQALAEAAGAKVFTVAWQGYAATKNAANAAVSGDYILSIDADEVLSEPLRTEIIRLKLALTGAYRLPRLNGVCGVWLHHGGWYPDAKVRLFPAGKAHWQGEFVHETLIVSPEIPIQSLQGDLLHYTISDIESHLQQLNRFTTLAAAEMYANGKQISLLKVLGSPIWKFIQIYFLKSGFRDGWMGFQVAYISAFGVFLRNAKVRALYRKRNKNAA